MEIEIVNINDLVPYENNPRQNDEAVAGVKESIKEFGFKVPMVIDQNNVIVCGHTRYKASKELGLTEIPCIRANDLTDEQIKAFRLADNKVGEVAEWDFDKLNIELGEIEEIDMSAFGFDDIEIDEVENVEIKEDEMPEDVETRCKKGDLWKLGNHRLICGDSTDVNVIERLMGGERADLFLTDPPYNVDYVGKTEDALKIQNDHFESDEQCGEELWLPSFSNALMFSKDCCSMYCFMPQGSTHMMMMMMMAKAGWQVKHELIWKKQSIVLNRADYNYQHEPFMYGWNKTHKFYGKGKFKNTSVWEFDRPTKSKEHPTMKPIELLCEVLLNATEKKNNVLDCFGGSGSTLIACEQMDRNCFICELDEHYCDVIITRWENLTGQKAELIEP